MRKQRKKDTWKSPLKKLNKNVVEQDKMDEENDWKEMRR